MTKRYEVTHVPHYIGQRWVEPGEVVTLAPGITPGRWLKLVAEDAPAVVVAAAAPVAAPAAGAAQFAAKHNGVGVGVGNYVVVRVADGSHASQVFKKDDGQAKERAEAEAERLNGGGEIAIAPAAAPAAPATTGEEGQQPTGDGLPDA